MLYMLDFAGAPVAHATLLATAWATLEAAVDLKDNQTLEACRRVIDATYRGETARTGDVNTVLSFFD